MKFPPDGLPEAWNEATELPFEASSTNMPTSLSDPVLAPSRTSTLHLTTQLPSGGEVSGCSYSPSGPPC